MRRLPSRCVSVPMPVSEMSPRIRATPSGAPGTSVSGPLSSSAPRHPRLVVFGDSDFLTNIQLGQLGASLGYFAVSWLSGQSDLIDVPARMVDLTPMILEPAQRRWILLVSVVLLPLAFLVGGVGYTTVRRLRR